MPDTTIDTLQVKITANAKSASDALRSLANALNRVRNSLTVAKDGLTATENLSKNLIQMNSALNAINTNSVKRLQKLANALNDYSFAVKRLKSVGSVAQNLRSAGKALGNGTEVKGFDSAKVSEEQASVIIDKLSLDYFGSISERIKGAIASLNRVKDTVVIKR